MFLKCDVSWWVAVADVFSFFIPSAVLLQCEFCVSLVCMVLFSRFLWDFCATSVVSFVSCFCTLVLLSFLSSVPQQNVSKEQGRLQEHSKCYHLSGCILPLCTSPSALTSKTTAKVSWSWQRGCAALLPGVQKLAERLCCCAKAQFPKGKISLKERDKTIHTFNFKQ